MSKQEKSKKPEIIVFAGPNGSGKSTVTQFFHLEMDYINADDIKRCTLCSDMEAAIKAEQMRESHVSNLQNFCFETVLSTDRNLNLLKRAKEKGYFIKCFYILTALPEINIMRIQARVGQGGHDVPEDKIISRYYRTLALIKDVIPICDICHIYDNSGDSPFRIFKKRKTEYYYDETDYWNFKDITALTQVANMEKRNLNIAK